jgi:hypothetical protein
LETKELIKESVADQANERRNNPGRRQHDGQVESQFLDMHPGWMKFILFCHSIKHGKIENLQLQDGIPVCIEKVKEKIKFLAVLYCVLRMVGESIIDVPFI